MKAAKLANKSIVIRIGEMITYANRRAEIVKLTGRRVLLNSVDSHTIDDVELFEFLKSLRLPEDLPDDDDDYEQPFAEHTSLLPWQLDELTRRVEVLHWLVYQEEQGARLNDVIGEACDKLGRRERSVRYWLARFKQGHDPVDKRWRGQVSARIDRRWISIAREHIVALYGQPRKTRDLFIEEVNDEYLETYGDDPTHQLPSASSAYRWIARLGFKKSVFDGSTETMRSKVDRDQGPGGKLIACYPGEYVMLDTHTLDLWGLDPVTRRPITLQITTAIDLFSREICALRVTAESTKAVDMSAVLFEMIYGQEAPEGTPAEAQFNYRGIPKNIVFTEDSQMWGMPCIVPTTLITDHGKALLNAQTLAVCRAFGIRIQPAQAYKPTDKAVMERFYRTLEHDIIQRLPGYKGNKVDHKGRKPELDAHYFPHEVDELIRLYICGQYHTDYHGGLINPDNPKSRLSPNGMYETGIKAAGFLRIPRHREDALLFLEAHYRYIHHYGVEIGGLIYQVSRRHEAFKGLRDVRSNAKGKYPGKYVFRVNPADLRYIHFQRPDDATWHVIPWEYADSVDMPFSRDISIEARTLAVSKDPKARKRAIKLILESFNSGLAKKRRHRRIATQLAAAGPSGPGSSAVTSSLIDQLDDYTTSKLRATDIEMLTDYLDEDEAPLQQDHPTAENYYDDNELEESM